MLLAPFFPLFFPLRKLLLALLKHSFVMVFATSCNLLLKLCNFSTIVRCNHFQQGAQLNIIMLFLHLYCITCSNLLCFVKALFSNDTSCNILLKLHNFSTITRCNHFRQGALLIIIRSCYCTNCIVLLIILKWVLTVLRILGPFTCFSLHESSNNKQLTR